VVEVKRFKEFLLRIEKVGAVNNFSITSNRLLIIIAIIVIINLVVVIICKV